jgi:hypothetical protein
MGANFSGIWLGGIGKFDIRVKNKFIQGTRRVPMMSNGGFGAFNLNGLFFRWALGGITLKIDIFNQQKISTGSQNPDPKL